MTNDTFLWFTVNFIAFGMSV